MMEENLIDWRRCAYGGVGTVYRARRDLGARKLEVSWFEIVRRRGRKKVHMMSRRYHLA